MKTEQMGRDAGCSRRKLPGSVEVERRIGPICPVEKEAKSHQFSSAGPGMHPFIPQTPLQLAIWGVMCESSDTGVS
jgi:hypothetical protein